MLSFNETVNHLIPAPWARAAWPEDHGDNVMVCTRFHTVKFGAKTQESIYGNIVV